MNRHLRQLQLSSRNASTVTVDVSGSKSITNRAYVLAALAHGSTVLLNSLTSDDTVVMSDCLTKMGVQIEPGLNTSIRITGTCGSFSAPKMPLFTGNSGTTIRFLTAASALAPPNATTILDGVPRMRQRTIIDLIENIAEWLPSRNCVRRWHDRRYCAG
jgi:3-phosphoshikimate 1-carboxyvinyltransferase